MWNAPQHQRPKPTIRKVGKSQRSIKGHVRFSSRIQIGHTWSSSEYDRHGCSGPIHETARPTSVGSTSGNRDVHMSMQPYPTPIGHTWSSSEYDRHGCSGPLDETARPTSASSISGNRDVHTSMPPYPTPDTALSANFSVGEQARPQQLKAVRRLQTWNKWQTISSARSRNCFIKHI